MPAVKVSIICTTYNQASFIRQALDGIVMQKTEFPFEALVYDDASTDGTSDIVREYAEKYPNIIRPILQTENQFSKGVDVAKTFIWPKIRGEYVAICDGDDYWTDDKKLQKQAEYLDRHPECSICFHKISMFFQDGNKPDCILPKKAAPFTLDGLIYTHHIPNVAVMYRWVKDIQIPDDIMPIDWYVHLVHAQRGKAGFIPDVMARYRRQSGGIWYGTAIDADAVHLRWGIHEMNFWNAIEKNIAPDPVSYHRFVSIRAREIFNAYVRNRELDNAARVLKMCPELVDDQCARRWQHNFNRLLIASISIITAMIITGVILL